jgi:hypothetical protein
MCHDEKKSDAKENDRRPCCTTVRPEKKDSHVANSKWPESHYLPTFFFASRNWRVGAVVRGRRSTIDIDDASGVANEQVTRANENTTKTERVQQPTCLFDLCPLQYNNRVNKILD